RPAVILTPTDQLSPASPIDVVAVTSRLPDPLPADHVPLPWHPRGHPRTGLNRQCAAVCSWLARIMQSDIQDTAGLVPTPLMRIILGKVASGTAPPPAPAAGPPVAGPGPAPPSAPPPAGPDGGETKPPGDSV